MIAFKLQFPKPTESQDIQEEMNQWLEQVSQLKTFDRWHWNPLGITKPQVRDWEIQIPDDDTAVMFKLYWTQYIMGSVTIK